MTHYTAGHWGIYEVEGSTIRPWRVDPDPNDIGVHMLAPELQRIRVQKPAVRRSWPNPCRLPVTAKRRSGPHCAAHPKPGL